jgi:LmbE family N-acetylglucosaminyl deacetylase
MSAPDTASGILSDTLHLLRRSPAQPDVAASFLSTALPSHDPGRPCALLLSPHPDDECLTGALPLRLKREIGWQIINVAVTLGSNRDRRAGRKAELAKSCAVLGFDVALPEEGGFSNVHPDTPQNDGLVWHEMTVRLAEIIAHYKPQVVFMPHEGDANGTHMGTHALGLAALVKQADGFSCALAETEYWQPNAEPNLMVGIDVNDAAALLTALACHAGENARNPFDARFPAYLIDNVRRGSERVGGKGASAAMMDFAMLYRIGVFQRGKFMPSALKRIIGTGDSVAALFDI